MTTALCFALDGTLVHRTRSDDTLLDETFTAHGIEPTAQLRATATETFRHAYESVADDPYRQSMAAVVRAAKATADPDEMVETLRERQYAATTVPDAARESLTGLAGDDTLAVVADGPRAWQRGKLDHHELTHFFDAVVTSYEAGAHKPDPAPFDLLCERLPADEYLMVGDETDVSGARDAGFVPIRYERAGPDFWATVDALL